MNGGTAKSESTAPRRDGAPRLPTGLAGTTAKRVAALLLGVACVIWAATPLLRAGWPGVVLTVAIAGAAASGLRLLLLDVPVPEDAYYQSPPAQAWTWFSSALGMTPWEEIAVAAIIWLEAMHPARPWHTAALGAGLSAYLLAAHVAESATDGRGLLRSHARVLIAGACLLALGAGAASLPAPGSAAGGALLRVLAAAAVIAAVALVLPGDSRSRE
jgi:hypothetical protein